MPSARVFNSGFFSRTFPITNGTRLGCLLSPILFALLIEPLAEVIKVSPGISGLDILGTNHKISLYAEGILVICTNPLQSIPELLHILDAFAEVSSFR